MNSTRRCLFATFIVLTIFFISETAKAQTSLDSILDPYLIWLDTKRDFAIVIATNISGQKAKTAFFALANELYAKFAKKQNIVK